MVGLVDEWMGSEVFGRLQPLSQVGLGTGEQEKNGANQGWAGCQDVMGVPFDAAIAGNCPGVMPG